MIRQGYFTQVLSPAKASPPGLPSIEKVGKNFVDLKWTKPRNDGGSDIKGRLTYVVGNYVKLLCFAQDTVYRKGREVVTGRMSMTSLCRERA